VNYLRLGQIFLSSLLAVLAGSILLSLFGIPPITGLTSLFYGGFFSEYGLNQTLQTMTPLLIMGIGLSVTFTARFWNIGGQGQYVMGSIISTWVGLSLSSVLPQSLLILVVLFSAFFAGALWSLPATLMKIYFGVNEVITTLMLNFVAVFLLDYLVVGPLQGPQSKALNAPASAPIPAKDMLGSLLPGGAIGYGLILAVFLAVIFFILLNYTNFGYELKLMGQGYEVSSYAGVDTRKNIILAMSISGGIAGIAGMLQVFQINGVLLPQVFSDITTSYGYVAIPVALIASLNPIAIIISSLFFSGILTGAYSLELQYGIPIDIVTTLYGLVMMFVLIGMYLNLERLIKKT
jgi:ABC-type uncharacterized transport system permease subunit